MRRIKYCTTYFCFSNDTITCFIFFCHFFSVFCVGSFLVMITCFFSRLLWREHIKTFNSFSFKLYLPSDVFFFSDQFSIYLFVCVRFFLHSLKERPLAYGNSRFCTTLTTIALCHIVTVCSQKAKKRWLKEERERNAYHFTSEFLFFLVSFHFTDYFLRLCCFFLRFDGIDCVVFFLCCRYTEYYFLFSTRDASRYFYVSLDSLWSRKLNRN